jgi:hypothetical protein
MFGGQRAWLLSTELARVWACSPTHILNLVEDGLLGLVDKPYVPREAMQISRQTACHFMQSRRIL